MGLVDFNVIHTQRI